jgi:hypothetical protein
VRPACKISPTRNCKTLQSIGKRTLLQKNILITGEKTMQKTISYKTILLLAGLLCSCLSSGALAEDKVVVIPMASAKPLQNVVTVGKAYGNFTDPVAAVHSITDASATNPYLVLIAPGTYTLTTTLVMKRYVDISGSGENITKLIGAISSTHGNETSAIVKGANYTTLSHLSISNTGGNNFSFGIYNTGLDSSAQLQQVLATATGGTSNDAIVNYASSPIMTGVNVIAMGTAEFNYGVYNSNGSSPIMTDVSAVVSGATTANYGVSNSQSSPTMTGMNTVVSGGTTNYGVYNFGSSSKPKIRRSSLTGATNGLHNDSPSAATISQSTILHGVSGGGATCIACDNGAGIPLNGSCL